MGLSKSKIPIPAPGSILRLVGIKEFDDFYIELEGTIKVLTTLILDIDTRTTYLIKYSGASSIWEFNPDIETVFKIILTILAVQGEGNIYSIVEISTNEPYFKLNNIKIRKKIRQMISCFHDFMNFIGNLENNLIGYNLNSEVIKKSENIQKKIAKYVIKENYVMSEKLEALKIVNENHEIIKKAPKDYLEMLQIQSKIKRILFNVLTEARIPPFSDILIQRGIQASSESIYTPTEIVKKFWPVI
jgi:hypothetical protein